MHLARIWLATCSIAALHACLMASSASQPELLEQIRSSATLHGALHGGPELAAGPGVRQKLLLLTAGILRG